MKMTSTRNQITELIEQGNIPQDKVKDALILLGISPDARSWRIFVDHLLLWIGGLAIAFALLFFIAYNWDDFGRLSKFAMVEAILVTTIISYLMLGTEKMTAKVALLMATIFLGVLLALFGQTYQTGADPWQLFFNWALLMLPWAFIGRLPAIWLLWVLLINISIILYHQALGGVLRLMFSSEVQLLWLLFTFNTIVHISWEKFSKALPWLDQSWAIRIIATSAGIAISWLVLYTIFDYKSSGIFPIIIWLVWMAAMFRYYRIIKPDLFMLAGFCMSGIVGIMATQIKFTLDDFHAGSFLYIALLLIALGTGSAIWLRNTHRELQ